LGPAALSTTAAAPVANIWVLQQIWVLRRSESVSWTRLRQQIRPHPLHNEVWTRAPPHVGFYVPGVLMALTPALFVAQNSVYSSLYVAPPGVSHLHGTPLFPHPVFSF
jgi:hypothetical protein